MYADTSEVPLDRIFSTHAAKQRPCVLSTSWIGHSTTWHKCSLAHIGTRHIENAVVDSSTCRLSAVEAPLGSACGIQTHLSCTLGFKTATTVPCTCILAPQRKQLVLCNKTELCSESLPIQRNCGIQPETTWWFSLITLINSVCFLNTSMTPSMV